MFIRVNPTIYHFFKIKLHFEGVFLYVSSCSQRHHQGWDWRDRLDGEGWWFDFMGAVGVVAVWWLRGGDFYWMVAAV